MINTELIQQFSRLEHFEGLDNTDLLRGTNFWAKAKRDKVIANPSMLENRPFYLVMRIVKKLAHKNGMAKKDWDEFYDWAISLVDDTDNQTASVVEFRKNKGDYPFQRMLLTNRRLIELYIHRVLIENL